MFVAGKLQNTFFPDYKCMAQRECLWQVSNVVDQIVQLKDKSPAGLKNMSSIIGDAEENSRVRVIKQSPFPNESDYNEHFNPDTHI